MREIISLHVGQCGNRIGEKFWEAITTEHEIDRATGQLSEDKEGNLNVLFREGRNNRYVPRAILVDTDPGCLDSIRSGGDCRYLFSPENTVHGNTGTSNNWGTGHYEREELLEQTMDVIRIEVERCDRLSGFQLTHSLSGGSGSGFGTRMLAQVREQYSDPIINIYSVIPDSTTGLVNAVYNSVLSIHQIVENADMCVFLDNISLSGICEKRQNISKPSFSQLNSLAASVMSDCCSMQRFSGTMGTCDWRKMAVNMVPFPRMHFFFASWVPVISKPNSPYANTSASDLCTMAYEKSNITLNINPDHGRYITSSLLCRGDMTSYEVEYFNPTQTRHHNKFAEWIPDNTFKSITKHPPSGVNRSVCMLGSSSAIQEPIRFMSQQFTEMFRRNAFIHWYEAAGMDKMEFTEAESNCNDLISEYQGGDCCCYEDESWDEEDE